LVILGIDPGTRITGYGVIERGSSGVKLIAYGEIKVGRGGALSECLKTIYSRLLEIIEGYSPSVISLEDIFYGKNVKSLIKQGHARGAIILLAAHNDIPVYEYSPLEVKKAVVGYGRAEKRQVQYMVKSMFKLSDVPPPDAADALAIAVCHSNFLKVVAL